MQWYLSLWRHPSPCLVSPSGLTFPGISKPLPSHSDLHCTDSFVLETERRTTQRQAHAILYFEVQIPEELASLRAQRQIL